MRHRRMASRFALAGLLFVTVGMAGCSGPPGAEVLEGFEPGTPKGEILATLPHGGVVPREPTDEPQLMQGYWHERYFIQGATVEVLWLHDPEDGYPSEAFRTNLNPVIFRDEALDGWGWEHFDLRKDEWLLVERGANGAGVEDPGVLVAPGVPQSPPAAPADTAAAPAEEGPGGEDSFTI